MSGSDHVAATPSQIYFAAYDRLLGSTAVSEAVGGAAVAARLPAVGASSFVGWIPGTLRFVECGDVEKPYVGCIFDPRPAAAPHSAAGPPGASGASVGGAVPAAVSGSVLASITASNGNSSPAAGGAGAGSVPAAAAATGAQAAPVASGEKKPEPPFDPAAAELPDAPPFGVLIRAWPLTCEQITQVVLKASGSTSEEVRTAVAAVLAGLSTKHIGYSESVPGLPGIYQRLLLLAKVNGNCVVTVTADEARLPPPARLEADAAAAAAGERQPVLALARPMVTDVLELFRGLKQCRFDPGTAARYINERAFKAGGFHHESQLGRAEADAASAAAGGAAAGGAGAPDAAGPGAAGGAGARPEAAAAPPPVAAADPFATMPVQWTAFQRQETQRERPA